MNPRFVVAFFLFASAVPWLSRALAINETIKSSRLPVSAIICILFSGLCSLLAGIVASAII